MSRSVNASIKPEINHFIAQPLQLQVCYLKSIHLKQVELK